MPTKKKARKKTTSKKRAPKKVLKRKAKTKKPARKKQSIRAESSGRRNVGDPPGRTSEVNTGMYPQGRRGLGPNAGGQSGDIQGLPRKEDVDSESVEELAEEGQAFQAQDGRGGTTAPDGSQRA